MVKVILGHGVSVVCGGYNIFVVGWVGFCPSVGGWVSGLIDIWNHMIWGRP